MLCNVIKGWYLCYHKHCHKSQCIKDIFIPVRTSFFSKGVQQSIKEFDSNSKREIKDSQYSEAAFESLIDTLSFLLKFLKHTCERVYFWRQLFLTFLESLELTVTN